MFPAENDFDSFLRPIAARHHVPVPLVKAIIAQESEFDPNAYREEARLNDASRGLMQVLLATARDGGFAGTPEQLFEPATSLYVGTKYLRLLLDRFPGNPSAAIAAYNEGPSRAAADVAAARSFRNQPYVDRVRSFVAYYAQQEGTTLTAVEQAAGSSSPGLLAVLVGGALLVLLGLAYFVRH
jgi:soluble lytic murein transglycosylase-like protein